MTELTELINFDDFYNDNDNNNNNHLTTDELQIKSQNSIKNYFEIESELIETKTKLQILEDKYTNLERLCFVTQKQMDIFRQNNEKYNEKNKQEEQKEKEEFKEKINIHDKNANNRNEFLVVR